MRVIIFLELFGNFLKKFLGNFWGIFCEFFVNSFGILNCILTQNSECDMKWCKFWLKEKRTRTTNQILRSALARSRLKNKYLLANFDGNTFLQISKSRVVWPRGVGFIALDAQFWGLSQELKIYDLSKSSWKPTFNELKITSHQDPSVQGVKYVILYYLCKYFYSISISDQ